MILSKYSKLSNPANLVPNNHMLKEIAQVLGHTSTSEVKQNKTTEALDSFFDRIDLSLK